MVYKPHIGDKLLVSRGPGVGYSLTVFKPNLTHNFFSWDHPCKADQLEFSDYVSVLKKIVLAEDTDTPIHSERYGSMPEIGPITAIGFPALFN